MRPSVKPVIGQRVIKQRVIEQRVIKQRVIGLRGSFNLRDLGGLTGGAGRPLPRGRIYRSEYPGFVADEGALHQLGLRTVVDLRRGSEAAFECVSWDSHAVAYRRCPLSAGAETSWHARYHAYLTHRPETVVEAVRQVMAPDNHPVLFHCAAGKDRTGVIAALVLSVLGVSDGDIVEDYLLTEAGLAPILDRLSRAGGPYELDLGYDEQRPRAETMRGFLAWLDQQGGAEEWLAGHGLARSRLADFRTAMGT